MTSSRRDDGFAIPGTYPISRREDSKPVVIHKVDVPIGATPVIVPGGVIFAEIASHTPAGCVSVWFHRSHDLQQRVQLVGEGHPFQGRHLDTIVQREPLQVWHLVEVDARETGWPVAHDRLPVRDAATVTGIPASTIRRWAAEGRITTTTRPVHVSVSELAQLRAQLTRPCHGVQ